MGELKYIIICMRHAHPGSRTFWVDSVYGVAISRGPCTIQADSVHGVGISRGPCTIRVDSVHGVAISRGPCTIQVDSVHGVVISRGPCTIQAVSVYGGPINTKKAPRKRCFFVPRAGIEPAGDYFAMAASTSSGAMGRRL